MPRPRKPTESLILAGAFKKDPQRTRPIGPKSETALGDPPDHLSDDECAIWHEAAHHAPANVLTGADRWLLSRFVQLELRVRLGTISASDSALHVRILSLLGWTPADRSRIHAEKPTDESAFAEFLQ